MDIARNKKAYHDYEILKEYETGIVLKGAEIKSIREHNVNLKDSFIKINYKGEVFLYNAHISNYKKSHTVELLDPTRPRKILLHKKEINKLNQELKERGFALVPLKLYFKKNYLKVKIGLAKGKKMYDKRQALKERDIKREIDKEMKRYR